MAGVAKERGNKGEKWLYNNADTIMESICIFFSEIQKLGEVRATWLVELMVDGIVARHAP